MMEVIAGRFFFYLYIFNYKICQTCILLICGVYFNWDRVVDIVSGVLHVHATLKSDCRLYASRYFMLYLDQSTTGPFSMPKVSWSAAFPRRSDGGALYFPRAKSMREKLHPGNMIAQSLPSWPALWAWVYVWCSCGSKENTLFRGNLQGEG